MAWPQLFPKKTNEEEPPVDPKIEVKPPETPTKSIAEMIAESLQPVRDEFAQIRQDINALKPTPKAREPQTITSVLDDEDAAFNQRMTPILQGQLELEAKYIRDQVKSEYMDAGLGDMWRQYEKDINSQLSSTQLVTPDGQGGMKKLRGDEQYIRNTVDMIIGRALRANGIKFDGGNKKFFLEGSNAPNSAAGNSGPKLDGLTEKQAHIANRMGIPLDKFKDTVSKMEFVK